MRSSLRLTLIFVVAATSTLAYADDEITLFSDSGNAVAYIDVNDELTIYLWSGKPVAYLERDSDGGYHVYGFNGKHLGWFEKGVVWDHEGNGSCAVQEVMKTTQFEPFKAFKQFKPFKSFAQFAPFRPNFSYKFGDMPCKFLLAGGGK